MAKTAKGTYFDPDELEAQIKNAVEAFMDFSKDAENQVEQALLTSALVVERDAKRFSPVDTGRLRGSITHRMRKSASGPYAEVGTNIEYGPFQEFGTSRMKPQPFLTPAFESNKESIKKRIADAIKQAEQNAEH